MTSPFQTRQPSIQGNPLLRTPQREAYAALEQYAANSANQEREVGIVLPVGCGKSGCITLAPFAFQANRILVVRLASTLPSSSKTTSIQRCHRCSTSSAGCLTASLIRSPSRFVERQLTGQTLMTPMLSLPTSSSFREKPIAGCKTSQPTTSTSSFSTKDTTASPGAGRRSKPSFRMPGLSISALPRFGPTAS